jgi:hypothetical protein
MFDFCFQSPYQHILSLSVLACVFYLEHGGWCLSDFVTDLRNGEWTMVIWMGKCVG